MKVREETLMRADFTSRELGRIKNISQRSGDTLGEAISDLARRFIITAVAVTFCLVVFFVLLILAQPSRLSLVLSVWLAALPLQHSPSHLLSLTKPGVSDALSATFVSRFLTGASPQEALRWANASGSLAIGKRGPMEGTSTQAQIRQFLSGAG